MSFLLYLPSVKGGEGSPTGQGDSEAMEKALLSLLTSHPSQGRPVVTWHPILARVARDHCRDMAKRGYESHISPEGEGPNYRLWQAGYRLPDYYGRELDSNNVESLQWGGEGELLPDWTAWLASPRHVSHLLGLEDFYRKQTNVGFGHTFLEGSRMGFYYCFLSAPPEPMPISR